MTIMLFCYVLCCVSRAVLEESPYSRMKSVVRWYLSGFYKKPKVHALCIHLHMQLHPSAFIIMHACVDAYKLNPPACIWQGIWEVVKHTHEHVRTHTYMHTYMRTLARTHTCVGTCARSRARTHVHTHVHTALYVISQDKHIIMPNTHRICPMHVHAFFAPTCTHDAVKEL